MRFETVVSTNLQLPQYVGNVIVASVVKVFLVNGTSASVHLPARDARISVVNLDGVIDHKEMIPQCLVRICD